MGIKIKTELVEFVYEHSKEQQELYYNAESVTKFVKHVIDEVVDASLKLNNNEQAD